MENIEISRVLVESWKRKIGASIDTRGMNVKTRVVPLLLRPFLLIKTRLCVTRFVRFLTIDKDKCYFPILEHRIQWKKGNALPGCVNVPVKSRPKRASIGSV